MVRAAPLELLAKAAEALEDAESAEEQVVHLQAGFEGLGVVEVLVGKIRQVAVIFEVVFADVGMICRGVVVVVGYGAGKDMFFFFELL